MGLLILRESEALFQKYVNFFPYSTLNNVLKGLGSAN